MTHPLLLEINTRCWLRSLSEKAGQAVTLANVPETEFHHWQSLGLTNLWLMGVWPTGPRSRDVCLASPELRTRLHELLPNSSADDLVGSPYAIAGYAVSATLGGEAGLKLFRKRLNAHGIKLILDFISNHMGLDHPSVTEKPELFVQSPAEAPGTFAQPTAIGHRWLAHGRDPNFPPWTDTVQLDYRRPATRAAMLDKLRSIAQLCDGVRCDLAMLLLNDVFAKTWAAFPAGPNTAPLPEFWSEAIPQIKSAHPDFLFLAEAYWDLEPLLQSLGFDYTYNKRIYDFLVERRPTDLRTRLFTSSPGFLSASTHFLENHDEPRIAAALSPAEHRAAALLTFALPGMRMLYEGQLNGRRLRVPVQFARWPDEPPDAQIQSMYQNLFAAFGNSAVGRGNWKLLRTNEDSEVVIVQWQNSPGQFDLIVVNLAVTPARCRVRPEIADLSAHEWHIKSALDSAIFPGGAHEFRADELLLNLPAHAAQLLRFARKS